MRTATVSVYAKPYRLTKKDIRLYQATNEFRPVGDIGTFVSDIIFHRDGLSILSNYGYVSCTVRKVGDEYRAGFHVKVDRGARVAEVVAVARERGPVKVVVR